MTLKKNILPYLLIAPGLLFIASLLIYPLITGLLSSLFLQDATGSNREFVGLSHFSKLLKDEIFHTAFVNTIIYTFSVVVGQFVIGLVFALLLNENFRGRGILRSLVLIPWIVPTIATVLTWRFMLSEQFGILNYGLKSLGIISTNIDWLGSSKYAMLSVIVTAIWKNIPFVAIVLLAALQAIDQQMYEAARIDGANKIRRFWSITLPSIKPVSMIVALLATVWTFNQFDIIFLMTKGGPANATQTIPVYTYLNAFSFLKLNYAAAIAAVGLVLLMIFVAVLYRKKQ